MYAEVTGVKENTLATWTYQDRLAGLNEARPGYPRYMFFGRSVRYWLPPGSYDPVMLANAKPTRYKSRKLPEGKKPAQTAVMP